MKRGIFLALVLVTAAVAAPATPPEPPPGALVDGDVVPGAEPAGVDAVEWEALTRGSETGSLAGGGLQALLETPTIDFVAFYKNLNGSLVADEDDAYHVYARRCGVRTTRTEDCAPGDIVFDHLVFSREATTDGRFGFEILSLTAENPVGSVLGAVTLVNPFGDPSGPGDVTLADANDPRRDPTALATIADEVAAGTRSNTETGPATENGVVRHFIPVENTTYPYPYERIAQLFDDADAPDLTFGVIPSGEGPRGGHGELDVTQSRATVIVSGRGARRTPLDPADEAALAIQHVDIAPTVARVLGIPVHTAARYLNNGDAASNPDASPALLLRQDGKPLDDLLEPRVNVFVLVIDGMIPENLTATQAPNLCNLIDCPGATDPDPSARSTVYEEARAVMVTQTNANHTAMLTGAYGEVNGVIANNFYNRAPAPGEDNEQALEAPNLIRVDTLFDVLRRELPHLRTAAVLGKDKLRDLYDCTHDANGDCIAGDTDNPEGVPVTHVRPDYLRGAREVGPAFQPGDCPAEPGTGSGIAADACVMDRVIELSATEDPDFVFVNLGNVDGIQHGIGPNSVEALNLVDGAVIQADAQIGRLVSYLKESGKWEHSVLIVTADHSFSWQGDPITQNSQRIDLDGLFAPCDDAGETFHIVSHGGAASVYLHSIGVTNTTLTTAQEDALLCMRNAALGATGVDEAWYRLENTQDPGATLAANRLAWGLDDQRAGDLLVTALASGPGTGQTNPLGAGGNSFEVASGPGFTLGPIAGQGAIPGDHGHPGVRHVPFIVASGGDFVVDQSVPATGAVNEGDDTVANPGQAEAVDIAPTVAWMLGLDPALALPDASGRVLLEAFHERPIDAVEPHANRAVVFIFDANNSVRIHELMADCDETNCANPENRAVPGVRSLLVKATDGRDDAPAGTLAAFGSMASFPTVTFPNHNVVGSGTHPGHHGIVGNRYYERDIETERDPIDPTDPRNPVFFFSSALLRLDFETLHEAVHRAFGDWQSTPADPLCDPEVEVCDGPSGAFTASVDEPSARGANFASLETVSSNNAPATFAALVANSAEFAEDTDEVCGQQDPGTYGQESIIDHLGQSQARALYSEPSTGTVVRPSGVNPLIIDETGGAAHPDPKYLIANFTLTDGAGHVNGAHGNCARRAYGDTSKRMGRILAELANHGRFDTQGEPARAGETFFVLTGDHGMENQDQDPAVNGNFDDNLIPADIEYIRRDRMLYLLTMDVQIAGVPPGGLVAGQQTMLTVTVTDSDRRADGSATPIAGALVTVESAAGNRSGLTDANGRAVVRFVPAGASVRVVVDRDADPNAGGPTAGSESPDPVTHGQVTKESFNDRVIELPVGG